MKPTRSVLAQTLAAVAVTTVAAGTALAYNVKMTTGGSEVHWPLGAHPVTVDEADGPLPGESEVELALAVSGAANTWSSALPGAPITLTMDGTCAASAPIVGSASARLAVVWAHGDSEVPPGVLALTFTAYDTTSGEILGARTVLNDGSFAFGDVVASPTLDLFDLQSLVTHELGHALGLAHSGDATAVMWAAQRPADAGKRLLEPDDVAGLRELYVDNPLLAASGCDLTRTPVGDGGGLWVVGVLVGLWLACRSRSRALVGCVGLAGVLVLGARPVPASSVLHLSVADLTRGSDVVILGRAVAVDVARVDDLIVTRTTIELADGGCLKGRCAATLIVWTYGGELPDGEGMQVDGAGRVVLGDDALLFLHSLGGGAYLPVGLAQGIFQIDRGTPGDEAGRDLTGLTLVSSAGSQVGRMEEVALAPLLAEVSQVVAGSSGGGGRQ